MTVTPTGSNEASPQRIHFPQELRPRRRERESPKVGSFYRPIPTIPTLDGPTPHPSLLLAPMPPPAAANSSRLLPFSNHRHHPLASPSPPPPPLPRPRPGRQALAPALFLLLAVIVTLLKLPPAAVGDPDDERCLTNLRQSLSDPTHSLRNWTTTTYAAPCNGFTSYLGGATCNNGRVYKLSLANLSLSGTLSPFLANCTNLQSLDLSSNALTGPIPPELSSLLNLAVLNLSANRLSGTIPPQLALCAYLNVIDLHANALSGFIPDQLGLLVRLSTFDVSYNQLSGPIPVLLANRSGGLPRFNASSFVGNKDLYGYPLPPAKGRGLSVLAIVGIGLGSGLLSLVLSFTAVCIWLRVTEQQGTMPGEEGKISQLMPDY